MKGMRVLLLSLSRAASARLLSPRPLPIAVHIVALCTGALMGLVMVLRPPERPAVAAGWAAIAALFWLYVREVRSARAALRRIVEQGQKALPAGPFFTARAHSVHKLAEAYLAIDRGEHGACERALRGVDRLTLGSFEGRVHVAVQALSSLARNDTQRAGQLAPLALPTGNADIDRTLARVLVRESWNNERRLRAVERSLLAAGRPLHVLSLLARVRQHEMTGSLAAAGPFADRMLTMLSEEARLVGDERLSRELASMVDRRGPYR